MEKIVLESKVAALLELLQKLDLILQEHQKNKRLQEFLLYSAEKKAEEIVELAISLNQELLRHKEIMGLSYYASFIELKCFPNFQNEELKALAATAGFRNRLAHDYLEINSDIALNTMKNMLKIYPPYLQKIKKIMGKMK